MAGASMVAVGTANFYNPRATLDVIEGIEKFFIPVSVLIRERASAPPASAAFAVLVISVTFGLSFMITGWLDVIEGIEKYMESSRVEDIKELIGCVK